MAVTIDLAIRCFLERSMFFRNVAEVLPDYVTSHHPSPQKSSTLRVFISCRSSNVEFEVSTTIYRIKIFRVTDHLIRGRNIIILY
jgi:hypothetical protein